jgi:hypothetical protein
MVRSAFLFLAIATLGGYGFFLSREFANSRFQFGGPHVRENGVVVGMTVVNGLPPGGSVFARVSGERSWSIRCRNMMTMDLRIAMSVWT